MHAHQLAYLNRTNHALINVSPIPLINLQFVQYAVTSVAFPIVNRISYPKRLQLNLVVLMYLIVRVNHYHMYQFVMMMIHVQWKLIFRNVLLSLLHVRLIDVLRFDVEVILNLHLFHQSYLDGLMRPGWV